MEGLVSFLEKNSIYIVLFIVLVVWTGIFIFLLSLDKRIKHVEKEIKGEKQ
ncbi:MAG: CcmD family protein [Ignavibacteriales bacterium]|nr:CcmD family protein [Ignavibacteriales bacterium]